MNKPVSISKSAFLFCKWTVAILLWISLIWKIKAILIVTTVILALSALFGIRNAPLVFLYTYTINKITPSKTEVVDEYAMRFAHTLGAVLNLICVLLVYYSKNSIGWGVVFVVAILKTLGAMGFCTALKLYKCMKSGNCCMVKK